MKIKIPVTIHPGDEVELDALLVHGCWAIVPALDYLTRQPVRYRYQVVEVESGLSVCHCDLVELVQACRYVKSLPPVLADAMPVISQTWEAFCKSEGISY